MTPDRLKPWVLGLALLSGLALDAADPAAVAAALRRTVAAEQHPQAGLVVLLDESVVTLDEQGRSTMEGHLLIKILQDRALREASDQKLPFRGDVQACDVLKAVTHLPSGETLEPEASGVSEVSDPEAAAAPFYSSARLKVVSFPGVRLGAVLELQYRVRPLPGLKGDQGVQPFSGEWLFRGPEPVLERSLTVQVPAGVKLRTRMFNGGPVAAVAEQDGRVRHTWVVRDQPEVLPEEGMVPWEELVPRLVWTSARDWRELGRWLHGRFRAATRPHPAVRAQALALTRGLPTPEARAERLVLFVTKEIRNVPLRLGRVGYQPTAVATILANRYADPLDKVALFQAMAEAAGLRVQPALVQECRTRLSALASLKEYQGILARVELPTGARFYNLTQDLAGLGLLLPDHAGRPGLLIGAAGGRAITLPKADPARQVLKGHWDAALDGEGTLTGRLTLTFMGLFDPQARSCLFGRNEEERGILFQALADQLKPGAHLEAFQTSDPLDLRTTPVVAMDLRIPDFACRQGDMMILNLGLPTPIAGSPALPRQPVMTHPFLVPASFSMESTLALRLPGGYRIAYQPVAGEVREGPFRFRLSGGAQGTALRLKGEVHWREGVVSPEAYPGLWRAFGEANGPGNFLVLLEKVGQGAGVAPEPAPAAVAAGAVSRD